MSRILYKYLDIKGGKMMIGNKNLQFTNATQLNDPFDCHPKLMDYSNVPDIVSGHLPKEWIQEQDECDANNLRNDTWLCSLSKIHDSLLMWSHYCWNHSGICIGLDIEKVMESLPPMFGTIYLKPLEIEVQYTDIINRPDGYRAADWQYQWRTKAKEWEYEQEVRLIVKNPNPGCAAFTPEQAKAAKKDKHILWDWKEIRHYMPLKGECFEEIYFGINIDPVEKGKIINFARTKLNPDIKLYQMQVDENAFRLKAELI